MKNALRQSVRSSFNAVGLEVVSIARQSDMYLLHRLASWRRELIGYDPEIRTLLDFCASRIERSHSQVLQDLFVLYVLEEKTNGIFVDFGATDGVELSNSLMLERDYGWRGIVAEPSKYFHEQLKQNRRCSIDFDCVSERSDEILTFNELPGLGLSTIDSFSDSDRHSQMRRQGDRYDVKTVSLNDLMRRHDVTGPVDYLSIDTEGSELSILSTFDFDTFRPSIITVEHNYVDSRRAALFELLSRHGYRRRFETISMFDDWYVHEDAPSMKKL